MYKPEDVESFWREFDEIRRKHISLVEDLAKRDYRTARGREYAVHGFSRRLYTLKECIEVLFDALPPDSTDIPTDKNRQIATIAVQAFLINLFGCVDNLARVWVEEMGVLGTNGQPLPDKRIGMGGKYAEVRASFSHGFRQYLDSRSEWLNFMADFRDALAHRISPYIPPFSIDPKNSASYEELGKAASASMWARDLDKYKELKRQQEALCFFRPWMTHSLNEESPLVVLHPQLIADFNTIEEMARNLLAELDASLIADN